MITWLRHTVVNFLTKHLLKAVTIDEVLLISGKDWLLHNRKLSQEEIFQIKEEAESIRTSVFWKLATKELKYGITLQRYDKAKTDSDMLFGKAMAYNFSLIQQYIDRVSKL